jgi:HD-GYP domain-containing protein (c-di-GMP phosphodiesterase class II)
MSESRDPTAIPRLRALTGVLAAAAALIVATVVGVLLVLRFVDAERERELRGWQVRLGIVADGRAVAVGDWLDRQRGTVSGLAGNASLRLYLSELASAGSDPARMNEAAAQAGYLRNLLAATADRSGFIAAQPARRVAATVQRPGSAGLAVLDGDGRVLVASPDMPPLDARLVGFVRDPAMDRALVDLYAGAGSRPSMAFRAPILGIQADPGSKPLGWVLGVREVDDELYPLLARPPAPEKTAESLLVRRRDGGIDFISPLADGSAPFSKSLAATTPNLAEAVALESPGGFAVARDYRDVEVLLTGRAVAGVPWVLVHKVDRSEALAGSDARLNRLLAILLLSIAGVAAVLVAVWRHAASRRASEAAARSRELAARLDAQRRLLTLVTDSQPAAMFIADREGRLRFANRVLGERLGTAAADLVGKALGAVFGPAAGQRYSETMRGAVADGRRRSATERHDESERPQIRRVDHIPLGSDTELPGSVLVVEEDITALVLERERRERTLRELVRALVTVVDRRDPYAANHSLRTAAVARRIAEEMGLDAVTTDTAETAGNLMNVGKILVPEQVLTRSGDLSDSEMRQVRDSIQAGAELLKHVEFDGPVVETLDQSRERWDGKGPRGLAGETILLPARVVAVANAFVALVSARAHRPGLGFDAAIDTLLKETGSAFDRRVVAALINVLDTRGGRAAWAEFARPAEAV